MSGTILSFKQSHMSPTARRFAKALVSKFPQFRRQLCVLPNGDVEAYITAPRTSKAGALVCLSHGSDVCVRFAPPRAVYVIDSTKELVSIVEQLLSNELVFVVLSKQRTLSGTTLIRRSDRPFKVSARVPVLFHGLESSIGTFGHLESRKLPGRPKKRKVPGAFDCLSRAGTLK